jgi:hypothetical protein
MWRTDVLMPPATSSDPGLVAVAVAVAAHVHADVHEFEDTL